VGSADVTLETVARILTQKPEELLIGIQTPDSLGSPKKGLKFLHRM
jgi:hypothetical protein